MKQSTQLTNDTKELITLDISSLNQCIEIDQHFPEIAWEVHAWKNIFRSHNYQVFSLPSTSFEKAKISNFALISFVEKSEHIELLKICVDPNIQNQKIGFYLMRNVLDYYWKNEVKCCFLQVAINNNNAIKLYESLGFRQTRTIKNFYKNKIDALEFVLNA